MAMNLDAVLKITAKVAGLDDLGRLEKGILGAEKAAKSAQDGFSGMVKSSLWQGAAVAATAISVGIGLATRAAIDFEASMTEVRKVVDGLDSQSAFEQLQSEVLALSKELPIAAEGFAAIYAAAGQSGIAREELEGFARVVSNVATAFDLTAEASGAALAQMKVALGLTVDQTSLLADAMNYLSNNTGSSGASLVEFMSRAAAVGKIAGLSGEQTAAFGAAMIQTGIQSEVAATAFRNMVGALSKGPAMTDKQKSALGELGYAMGDAAAEERRLTQAVEAESQRRLDAARDETDELLKEIRRRYRDQERLIGDRLDDQTEKVRTAAEDRADAQVDALRREQTYMIKMAEQRAQAAGRSADAEVESIRRFYEGRIEAVQDGLRVEVKAIERSARDKRQAIGDQLEDQQEMEVKAVNARAQEVQRVEEARREEGIQSAKESAKATADGYAQAFSDGFQRDALGTIRQVLGRIAALPEAQQLSTLTSVFGEEAARGIAPLLSNLGELDRVLGLVGDSANYAGSSAAEAAIRAMATDAQLQIFFNNLRALAIEIGKSVLPALVGLARALGPIIQGLSQFAQQNPLITTAVVAIGGAFAALVAAAPIVASILFTLNQFGITFAGFGTVFAGAMTVVQVAFSGFLTWLTATALPAILAFFSGPVGWTVLAVAAVVAMCLLFREPIMEFGAWLGEAIGEIAQSFWEWTQPIRDFWVARWEEMKKTVEFWAKTIGPVMEWAMKAMIAVVWGTLVAPWIRIWDNILKRPIVSLLSFLTQAWSAAIRSITNGWQAIGRLWDAYVIRPVVGGWNLAISNITNAVAAVVSPIQDAWQAIRTGFESYIVEPIQSMWTSLMGFIKGALNGFLSGFGSAVNAMVGIVNQLVDAYNAIPIRPFTLSRLPTFTVPQFADGGVVSAPTLAMVGEGGEPEYIIPESKMAQASSNFMDGARGASVLSGRARQPQIITPRVMTWQEYNAELERTRKAIMKKESLYLAAIKKREALDKQAANKMREQMKMWEQMKAQGAATDQLDGVAIPASLPGYMRSTSVNAGLGATIKPEPTTVQINITTGPVLEFNDERWVKVKDLNRAMQQTADAVLGRMRTPRTRMALGAR